MYYMRMWITLPKPNIGDITVNVTDGTDAISSASVVLTDSSSEDTTKTTGDDGAAVFDNVGPGTYTLSVSKSGYATVTQTIIVSGDATIDIELVPTRSCSFTIDDGAAEPTGISGAQVVFDGDTENKKTTGGAGGFTVTLADGEHSAAITAIGYKDKTANITVDSTHTSFTISLEEDEGS